MTRDGDHDPREGAEDGNGNPAGEGNGPGRDPDLVGILGQLARSMGSEGLEIGGDNVRFEQAPEEGLEVRITLLDDHGTVTSVASMFLPADEPPPAHPVRVPFLPGAALRVIEDHVRRVTLAMWLLDPAEPDVDGALDTVVRASRDAGWRLHDTQPARLRQGDRVRRIEVRNGPTGPVVSLSEKHAPQEPR